MLGYLLARAGVQVIVLEKHKDFFRDFRGDTIHPSTLEVLHELGLLEKFLQLPHQEYSALFAEINGRTICGPDFSALPTHCKFLAIAPQWDFLNFLADAARSYPTFQLRLGTEAVDLIRQNGKVVGVRALQGETELSITCDLTIAADGRNSRLRAPAGLKVREFGAPIDVLWFRMPKHDVDQVTPSLGRINNGKMLITLDRLDYFQCGMVIRKGTFPEIQQRGLEAFQEEVRSLAGFSRQSLNELTDWSQVKILSVQLNRLEKWQIPGMLFIGDAAHAMSPAGGVGVNIAIQDAVATANHLAGPLLAGTVSLADLEQVQRYREPAVIKTQRLQAFLHRRLFSSRRGFGQTLIFSNPVRWLLSPFSTRLRHIGGRIMGMGFQPEHVKTPENAITSASR